MIVENLQTLKIHKLTETQYQRALSEGNIDPNALYLTPDESLIIDNTLSIDGAAADAKAVGDANADIREKIAQISSEKFDASKVVQNTGDSIENVMSQAAVTTALENLTTLPYGGYYTPTVTQTEAGTMTIGYTASKSGMPKVEDQKVELPVGPVGVTPKFTVGTVITGEAGADAAVSITGSDAEPVLRFVIPQGPQGDTPVKGLDYWTEEERQAVRDEANAIIAEELAKRGQLKPEFANSVEECTDTTKLYVLPDGHVWAYMKTEISGEKAAFGTPDLSVYPTVLSAESSQRYTFSKTAATLSGKLKSVTIKCEAIADVIFAVAHISGVEDGIPVVASIDEFTITTKVGENTYVNGTDFTYDGEVQEGDLIGYKQAIGTACKVYYGTVSDTAQQCYNTPSHTDYTLTSKTYGYAISAVVETESVEGYAWADTGHTFIPADYEDRIVALEKETAEQGTVVQALSEDMVALKENGAKAACVVIGTEIDPGVADYSDSEAFVIKVKPSALTGTLTMEKSEDTNTSAVRQVCYVDFSGGMIGFYGRCADGATLTVYEEQVLGFDLVAGHEYVVEMIKKDSKYAILRITDAYSMDSDEISCSEYAVGRGWGARKYSYTGDAGDILSVKSYVLQNKKTRLMIVGDSYIEGSSLPENGEDRDGRYAMLMKKALGGDCFINGRGGAASADMLGWFNGYLPEVCRPEYVILSCGGNDSNYDNWVTRLQSIIAKVEEMGAKPILTTIAALSVGNCKDIWRQQNAWIRSSGYDYIDINLVTSLDYGMESIDPDLFYSDAVHPNTAGHARIFKRARLDVPYLFV